MAARFVRDEEAAGSNPATPTRSFEVRAGFGAMLRSPFSIFAGLREPNGEPLAHADLAWLCWLKMVFMVSAPLVITGLSWCR